MRNASNDFRQEIDNDNRNYLCQAIITLINGEILEVDNTDIWFGGVSVDDNVSDSSSFTSLGSVIINSASLIINNIDDDYSSYDFKGAIIFIKIGLNIDEEVEYIPMFSGIINNATYSGSLITLDCLDNMTKFDKPYINTQLEYPATLGNIIYSACTECSVPLAPSMESTFPNHDLEVSLTIDSSTTYREVISKVAELAGCFTRCNSSGELELKWFNSVDINIDEESDLDGGIFDSSSPYSSGDTADGGSFNPWNNDSTFDGGTLADKSKIHIIDSLSSQDIGTDDITITGIRITFINTTKQSKNEDTVLTYDYGTDDYIIKIENNPFITKENVDFIGRFLWSRFAGLTFRKASISHLSNPIIEAGDVAVVIDRKQNRYPILITNTIFKTGSYQQTTCAAETQVRNNATQYTQEEKNYETLTEAINAKAGLYETHQAEPGGGYKYYLHDNPKLDESTVLIEVTVEGIRVSPDSGTTWYGLTVDGNFIGNIMSVIGINFDWGTGGTLTLGGQDNVNGNLIVKDENNNIIGTWNNTGITFNTGVLQSADYEYESGTYSIAGMCIDLVNKFIRSTNYSLLNGTLYASGASLEGSLVTRQSNRVTSISGGSIRFYVTEDGIDYQSARIFPGNWISDYTGSDNTGIAFYVEPKASYLAFGHNDGQGSNYVDFMINNGLNPGSGNYIERIRVFAKIRTNSDIISNNRIFTSGAIYACADTTSSADVSNYYWHSMFLAVTTDGSNQGVLRCNYSDSEDKTVYTKKDIINVDLTNGDITYSSGKFNGPVILRHGGIINENSYEDGGKRTYSTSGMYATMTTAAVKEGASLNNAIWLYYNADTDVAEFNYRSNANGTSITRTIAKCDSNGNITLQGSFDTIVYSINNCFASSKERNLSNAVWIYYDENTDKGSLLYRSNASGTSITRTLIEGLSDGTVSLPYTTTFGNQIKPDEDGNTSNTVGRSDARWYQVWSTSFNFTTGVYINYNATNDYIYASKTIQQASDENLKNIFEYDLRYDTLIDRLEPIVYTWKDSASNKQHVGLGARKTKKLLDELKLTDSGFVGIDLDEDGNETYSIDYSELSVMLLHTVQTLKAKIEELERRL